MGKQGVSAHIAPRPSGLWIQSVTLYHIMMHIVAFCGIQKVVHLALGTKLLPKEASPRGFPLWARFFLAQPFYLLRRG
jgi:hypothetical protein